MNSSCTVSHELSVCLPRSREEEQTRSTAAAQRRAELEQRAEQKKIEAVAEAKRQAREEMRQLRWDAGEGGACGGRACRACS